MNTANKKKKKKNRILHAVYSSFRSAWHEAQLRKYILNLTHEKLLEPNVVGCGKNRFLNKTFCKIESKSNDYVVKGKENEEGNYLEGSFSPQPFGATYRLST